MVKKSTKARAVAKAQARIMDAGGERLTLMLYPEDAKRWRKVLARYGAVHGAKMMAFRDALEALEAQGVPSPEAALRVLSRLVKARDKL